MKFTESHEWVEVVSTTGIVGVTTYAQKQLGEVVFVELPKIGREVKAGEVAMVLESTKSAVDIYAPISGTIIEVNEAVRANPGLINTSPEKEGWLFKVQMANPEEMEGLLDLSAYNLLVR